MRLLTILVLVGLGGCSGPSEDPGDGAGGSSGNGGTGGTAGDSGSGGIPDVPESSCPDFQACGGDLDGRWLVREACVDRAPEDIASIVASCPSSSNAGMTIDASGSYDFDLGLLTVDLEVTTTVTVAFTSSCARALNTDLESLCAEYGDTQAMNAQFSSTDCTVVGGECRCTLVGVPASQNVFMNYDVAGNEFTDSSGGSTQFCVEGTRLWTRTTQSGDVITIGLDHE